MKVLFIEHSKNKRVGGLDACCERLASTLKECGVNVSRSAKDLNAGETAPEIIHRHGMWNLSGIPFEMRTSLPRVCSPHGMLEPWSLNQKKWRKRLAWMFWELRLLNSCRVVHATSLQEVTQLRKLGVRSPVALVPLGTEVPSESVVSEFRVRPENRVREVIFLSRIHPKKGLVNLVRAWEKVSTEGWRLRVIGPEEGNYSTEVRNEVRLLGLGSSVSIEEPLTGSDKWNCLCSADLVVLPTYSENFGLIVAEALACGVPTIATKGSPWEDLVRYDCGWWIEIGIAPLVAALAEAMALTDRQRFTMGDRGRALVQSKYAWPQVAQRLACTYEWCLRTSSDANFGVQPEWMM